MSLANLDNLVKTGQLKIESFEQKEFKGLVQSGKTRFKDANNATLAHESRFDLDAGEPAHRAAQPGREPADDGHPDGDRDRGGLPGPAVRAPARVTSRQ